MSHLAFSFAVVAIALSPLAAQQPATTPPSPPAKVEPQNALLVPPKAKGSTWLKFENQEPKELYVRPGALRESTIGNGKAYTFEVQGTEYAILEDDLSGTSADGSPSGFRRSFGDALRTGNGLLLRHNSGTLYEIESVRDRDYANDYFMIHAGVVNSRPYTFTRRTDSSGGTHLDLDRGAGSSPSGYVEAYFRRRSAWLADSTQDLDAEVRLGFTFAAAADTEEKVVSRTALGTGDFFGDVEFALPRLGAQFGDFTAVGTGRARGTIAPALHAGWSTDRGFQALHGYYGAGLATCMAFPTTSILATSDKQREVQLRLGLFGGIAEYPDFLNDTSREVRLEYENPYFTRKGSMMIEVQANIPFGDNRYFVISGNFIDRFARPFDLATWSLMIGVTIPIGDVAAAIF